MTHFRLLDLPREVLQAVCLAVYDPLTLTQQDRLTWGIFSTVDMHQERQDDLASLIALGKTCRKLRKEARVVTFRCIRTPTVRHVYDVIDARKDWAGFVKSVIIDLTMFDHEGESSAGRKSRSCWGESALLFQLIDSMPNLQHVCFFADASDDTTLALLFSSLIEHPSTFPLPPSPAVAENDTAKPLIPFIDRLRSFSWRQRADPPAGFKRFYQASTFVSTFHLLRHAHGLSFLVLDADMDEMGKEDVCLALKELQLRRSSEERRASEISLMLCGPIRGWEDGFLQGVVDSFQGIKELFIDRPLYKSKEAHGMTSETFLELLSPLSQLPHLQLLQVGSYTFPTSAQAQLVKDLALNNQNLTVVGLLGEMGDTTWWGIWRRNSTAKRPAVSPSSSLKLLFPGDDLRMIAPLEDGHLAMLEEEVAEYRQQTSKV